MNWAIRRPGVTECVPVSAVHATLPAYDYSQDEKSLATFAIFRALNQQSLVAH